MNFKVYLLKLSVYILLSLLFINLPIVLSLYHPPPGGGGEDQLNALIIIEYEPTEPKVGEAINFQFTVKDRETGSTVIHIDYVVKVLKDGEELFRKQFHDHEGDLSVTFEYMEGDVRTEGSAAAGGIFTVYGPIFPTPGTYDIVVSVVGIEFSPINPFSNQTTITILEADQPMEEPPQEDTTPDEEMEQGEDTTPDDAQAGDEAGDGGEGVQEEMPVEDEMVEEMPMDESPITLFIVVAVLIAVGIGAFVFLRGRI